MPRSKAARPAISGDAVRAKTSKAWTEWFAILDREGAQQKDHKAIASYLRDMYRLSPWWSQMVAVRYEQERGLRVVGQRSGGSFELSIQRTIRTSARKAFEAFTNPVLVGVWFTTSAKADLRVGGTYENADGDRGKFLLIEPPKRLKFTWDNKDHCPGTVVEVTFTVADRHRTTVRLQQTKLESKKDREDMKEGWSWALDSLKSYLETGNPIPHEDWLKQPR